MLRLASSALALVLSLLANDQDLPSSSVLAFSPAIPRSTIISIGATPTALRYHPSTFDRAVECVDAYGTCDVDELVELSAELEQFQGCFYESDPKACAKEIHDRKDLADALLLQGELRERNEYVQDGNLFAYHVKSDSDMLSRDEFFEKVAPTSLDI